MGGRDIADTRRYRSTGLSVLSLAFSEVSWSRPFHGIAQFHLLSIWSNNNTIIVGVSAGCWRVGNKRISEVSPRGLECVQRAGLPLTHMSLLFGVVVSPSLSRSLASSLPHFLSHLSLTSCGSSSLSVVRVPRNPARGSSHSFHSRPEQALVQRPSNCTRATRTVILPVSSPTSQSNNPNVFREGCL